MLSWIEHRGADCIFMILEILRLYALILAIVREYWILREFGKGENGSFNG